MNPDGNIVPASAVRTLTSKQEKFCELVASGSNLSEAYRAAYDAGEMKPATVNRKAKEVADNGKIAARIGELREVARKASMATRDEIVQRLTGIMRDKGYKPEITMAAAGMIANMEGFNAPSVTEVKEHISVNITTRRTTAQMRDILKQEATLFDNGIEEAEIVEPKELPES